MDGSRFDRLTRSLAMAVSRRALLASLSALGLSVIPFPGAVDARKRRKRKPEPNKYGCLDVGKACRGNDNKCCSGICKGKKPKKGERDKSSCVGHDADGCQAGQDVCAGAYASCGGGGPGVGCYRTTGKASFCALGTACQACRNDADCEELGYGKGAACLVCPALCPVEGTLCGTPRSAAG
jgi:hypothetical protein